METKDKNEIELLQCWRELTDHDKEVILLFINKLAENARQELYKQFKIIK